MPEPTQVSAPSPVSSVEDTPNPNSRETGEVRYPLEPLLAAMGCTLSAAAPILGLGGPEYRKYRDLGMNRDTAERKANKAGFHVYEVWPEMVEHDLASADEAERERRRRYNRNWYRNADPEVKARVLASARRYKASAARALSLYNRRYREQNRERMAARQREHYLANRERILARQREYDRRKAAERRLMAQLEAEQIPHVDRPHREEAA